MTTKDGTTVTYADAAHKHAASSGFGNSYSYDANGNQTTRNLGGTVYTLTYDYENRLTAISGGTTASFVYDADGTRVKSTVGGVTTVYIAGLYEFIENGATDKVTKYYEGNALRRSGYGVDDGVFYLLRDHLSSSSVILNQSGTVVTNGNQYYTPYGSNRGGTPFSAVTTKRFTGQYHENGLTQSEGLSYYGARWYDAKLGRFLSADSIVPQPADPQSLNRYSYVRNNPTGRIDPTGHADIAMDDGNGGSSNRLPISIPAWRPQSQHSAWYSGAYSGCFMCHAGGGRVLTNTELLESWQRMNQTQRTGVEIVSNAKGNVRKIAKGKVPKIANEKSTFSRQ